MRVNDSSVAEQLIAYSSRCIEDSTTIGVAILDKQQEVEKTTSTALLDLLKSSVVGSTSRGRLISKPSRCQTWSISKPILFFASLEPLLLSLTMTHVAWNGRRATWN